MKQIVGIQPHYMRNEEHFGFMKLVSEQLPKLPEGKAVQFSGDFTTALDAEDAVLEMQRRSALTASLSALDEARDNAWRGIRSCVSNGLSHFKPEVVQAAQRLDAVLAKFGDPRSLPYIQENGAIENLRQELEILKSDVAAVGAADWLAELAAKNKEFIAAFSARNNEQAGAPAAEAVKTARTVTDGAYRVLAQVINASALMEGEATYAPFIDEVNALIAYQHNVIARRKASGGTVPPVTAEA